MGRRREASVLGLLFVGVALLLQPASVRGHASNLITDSCSKPLEVGTQMMGKTNQPSSVAAVQILRGGVALSGGALTYNPGETLQLVATGSWSGEIGWEASGGALFPVAQTTGCNRKRSIVKQPNLVMPTNGASVTVWAGHAGSKSTVYITNKVTLTANKAPTRAPTATPPAPAPGPAPAPQPGGGAGGGGTMTTPAPTLSPTPSPTPGSSGSIQQTHSNFAAFFSVTLHGVAPEAFDVDAAKALIARTAQLSPSQVYVVTPAGSTTNNANRRRRRLQRWLGSLGRALQTAPAAPTTELAIWLTNLPDRETANGLLSTVNPYLIRQDATGFGLQYATETGGADPVTVVLNSSSASTYEFAPLGHSCLISSGGSSSAGMVLSWDVQEKAGYVDLQLTAAGEGWVGGGLVDGRTSMVVTNPAHRVMIYDYAEGTGSFFSMEGYEASELVAANGTDLGATPLLTQAAGGRLVMRYRQALDPKQSSVPIDLGGATNFMYAWSPFGYPNMHTVQGTTTINWAAGSCSPALGLPEIEGYYLLLLPLLAMLVTWACLRRPFCAGGLGRTLLQRRLGPMPARLPTWLDRLTLGGIAAWRNLKFGELAVVGAYLSLQVALLLYWSLQAGAATRRSAGVALGKAALTNVAMAFLPVSKTSLWTAAVGLSFERAVKFHRWLSYLAMVTMTAHLACFVPLTNVWSFSPTAGGVIVGCGTVAYLCFATMSATALLRRWAFELFRYLHYLFLAGVGLLVIHAPEAWLYLIAPCSLHFLDFAWRWLRSIAYRSTATLHALPGGLTRVDIRLKSTTGRWREPLPPGSYVFICVPAISAGQWHPISISSLDAEEVDGEGGEAGRRPGSQGNWEHVSLHVKALGQGTWTHDLHQLALEEEERRLATPQSAASAAAAVLEEGQPQLRSPPPVYADAPLDVLVDGPYGHLSVDLGQYRKLVLVAGGIGITPMISTLAYLAHQKRARGGGRVPYLHAVTLVWAVRDEAIYQCFVPFLGRMAGELNRGGQHVADPAACSFDVQLYATSVAAAAAGGAAAGGAEHHPKPAKPAKHALPSAPPADGAGSSGGHRAHGVIGAGAGGVPPGHLRRCEGRPNLCAIFDELIDLAAGEQDATAVLACAPPEFLTQVQRQCVLRDVDLHMEEFGW